MNPPLPCLMPKQQPPVMRPNWYGTGTPLVFDPKYQSVPLVICPLPLRCFKSAVLPDGSYWMWLGGPWYRSQYTVLSGMLFFATSWEYWVLLQFLQVRNQGTQSAWQGGPGTGRMNGQVASITATGS